MAINNAHQFIRIPGSFNADHCLACGQPNWASSHVEWEEKAFLKANQTQVAGEHYKSEIQHWDFVWANGLDYFQGQITKYVARHRGKNGLEDLYKAKHFLQKYIELLESEGSEPTGRGYVDQDR